MESTTCRSWEATQAAVDRRECLTAWRRASRMSVELSNPARRVRNEPRSCLAAACLHPAMLDPGDVMLRHLACEARHLDAPGRCATRRRRVSTDRSGASGMSSAGSSTSSPVKGEGWRVNCWQHGMARQPRSDCTGDRNIAWSAT
jgi:hypothetical protein